MSGSDTQLHFVPHYSSAPRAPEPHVHAHAQSVHVLQHQKLLFLLVDVGGGAKCRDFVKQILLSGDSAPPR